LERESVVYGKDLCLQVEFLLERLFVLLVYFYEDQDCQVLYWALLMAFLFLSLETLLAYALLLVVSLVDQNFTPSFILLDYQQMVLVEDLYEVQ
jgi:hypothetical protein